MRVWSHSAESTEVRTKEKTSWHRVLRFRQLSVQILTIEWEFGFSQKSQSFPQATQNAGTRTVPYWGYEPKTFKSTCLAYQAFTIAQQTPHKVHSMFREQNPECWMVSSRRSYHPERERILGWREDVNFSSHCSVNQIWTGKPQHIFLPRASTSYA